MKVAVVITARPSFARIQTCLEALVRRGVDLHLVVCGSALLERYGAVVNVIRKDFPDVPVIECWTVHEGGSLLTSAKETGALLVELAGVLSRLRPDVVVCIADRHEVLAAAQAAAYQHLPLLHVQGGETCGSIDRRVRDSITHLADVHCVATANARYRVYGLTGDWKVIHVTGCPSVDLALRARAEPPVTAEELGGSGAPIDLAQPFIVVLQHPVTNEAEASAEQMETTLAALATRPEQTLVFWPGEDAGADAMSKVVRGAQSWVHTVRNLPPHRFLRLLTQAACLVGNSSCGIRECSALGLPVVNIGSRQQSRERAGNVVDVPHEVEAIRHAVRTIAGDRYASSSLYGRGDAGERMADVLLGGL